MNQRFDPFQLSEPESPALTRSPAAAIYTHPDDVVSDTHLTTAEKRAVLASWISDARAVESAPALRRLDSGAVVEVDAIRRALVSLDGSEQSDSSRMAATFAPQFRPCFQGG